MAAVTAACLAMLCRPCSRRSVLLALGVAAAMLACQSYPPASMEQYFADDIEQLTLKVGQPVALESLRMAVRPPCLMRLPFVEVPPEITVVEQRALEEEGVHGSTFVLEATQPVEATLTVGLRDLQSEEITHMKTIQVSAR